MAVIEVKNAAGKTVWTSPEVEVPLVEEVDSTIKVFDFNTGQVLDAYVLKPGEYLAR